MKKKNKTEIKEIAKDVFYDITDDDPEASTFYFTLDDIDYYDLVTDDNGEECTFDMEETEEYQKLNQEALKELADAILDYACETGYYEGDEPFGSSDRVYTISLITEERAKHVYNELKSDGIIGKTLTIADLVEELDICISDEYYDEYNHLYDNINKLYKELWDTIRHSAYMGSEDVKSQTTCTLNLLNNSLRITFTTLDDIILDDKFYDDDFDNVNIKVDTIEVWEEGSSFLDYNPKKLI